MSVCLLLVTDGRGYLDDTVASLMEMAPDFQHEVLVDDSAHEFGFAGAIQRGWERVLETDAEFVFHIEDDFLFRAPIPIPQMAELLRRRPKLAQVALKRQPWNETEQAAGGIVEADPDRYVERSDGADTWTEHEVCFTTNPSLYPAALCHKGWPQQRHSEGVFTHQLLADGYHFAFWGEKFAPPMVEHIGAERVGYGY